MNCDSLAWMNGQHAPTGRPTVSGKQALRSLPCHTASTSRKRTVGMIVNQSSRMQAMVSRILVGELSSRVRMKPIAPVVRTGAERGATIVFAR